MNRLSLASLALVAVALGSTGCSYHHRCRVRYARMPMRMHAMMYAPQAVPQAPPPPVEMAPQPTFAPGSQTIVVHANPGATVIVVGGAPGSVRVMQGGVPQQGVVMPRQEPAPQPAPQQDPNAWFEEE